MRTSFLAIPLALLGVFTTGCPDQKEQSTSRTGHEYKTASEGFKAVLPTTENLPNQKALNNIKSTMEQADKSQERYEQKAAAAGSQE